MHIFLLCNNRPLEFPKIQLKSYMGFPAVFRAAVLGLHYTAFLHTYQFLLCFSTVLSAVVIAFHYSPAEIRDASHICFASWHGKLHSPYEPHPSSFCGMVRPSCMISGTSSGQGAVIVQRCWTLNAAMQKFQAGDLARTRQSTECLSHLIFNRRAAL